MKNQKKTNRPSRDENEGRPRQPKHKKPERVEPDDSDSRSETSRHKKSRIDPRQERELRKRPLKYFLEEE